MTLSTRKPTGEAGWPNLLVEGKEGAGKTYSALRLSADPRIGAAYVVEVGERRADEYAALGEFDIVEHDGTIHDITNCITDVLGLPPVDAKPTLLVIDSGTALWDLAKREVDHVSRQSKAAKAKLAQDPDADIESGHYAWNKVTDRYWWPWVDLARAWPGILLLTARADEVSKFVDGKPVTGQSEYRVDMQKGTPFALEGTVRCRVGEAPRVVSAKSLRFQAPCDLPRDDSLAHCVFDLFGAGTEVRLSVPSAKAALLAHCRAVGYDTDEAKKVAGEVWSALADGVVEFGAEAMRELVDAVKPAAVARGEAKAAEATAAAVPGEPDPPGGAREEPPARTDPREVLAEAKATAAAGVDKAKGTKP